MSVQELRDQARDGDLEAVDALFDLELAAVRALVGLGWTPYDAVRVLAIFPLEESS